MAFNKYHPTGHILNQLIFVFIILDQEWIPFGKTPTVTAKIDDKDKHVATDDTSNTLNTGIYFSYFEFHLAKMYICIKLTLL